MRMVLAGLGLPESAVEATMDQGFGAAHTSAARLNFILPMILCPPKSASPSLLWGIWLCIIIPIRVLLPCCCKITLAGCRHCRGLMAGSMCAVRRRDRCEHW